MRRFRPEIIENLKAREGGTADEAIMALLETKQPLELAALLAQSNLPADEAGAAIESLIQQGRIAGAGEGEHRLLFTASGWQSLAGKAVSTLTDYHKKFPTRSGMPKVELSSRLKLGSYIPAVLAELIGQGVLVEEGGHLRLPSHSIQLTPVQQGKIDAFLKSLAENPYAPPGELIPEPDLLNMLIEQGKAVKVSDNVVFSTQAYNEMVGKITAQIKG